MLLLRGQLVLRERGFHGGKLCVRLRNETSLVVAEAVFPVAQTPGRLGGADGLLTGGDETGKPLFQRVVRADGESELPDEGAALKDAALHAEQDAATVFRRQLRNRNAGVLFIRAELPHRGAAATRALEDDDASFPVQLDLTSHRCARPRLIFRLCGNRAGLRPLSGVNAVEHREQKLRPGRFAALVREREDIEAGRERQLGVLQTAEAGVHTENGHASSLPSMAARSIRAASAAVRRAASSGALS